MKTPFLDYKISIQM